MRTDTIIIGGVDYPVKGLSVTQSLTEDILAADANQSGNTKTRVDVRLRRMAISLQNAKAFLPDPANPKGQFATADLTPEKVCELLDGDLFSDAKEFYDAEIVVMALTGFGAKTVKSGNEAPKGDEPPAAGEAPATE
jgi:hypothetical protein